MQVQEIMTRSPAFCYPESTLQEVANIMVHKNCGIVPIVETSVHMVPLGVITDRDITCRTVALGKDPLEMTAREVMSAKPLTVSPTDSMRRCEELMEQNDVRRMLVVDQEGKCVGIVAQADIARNAPVSEVAELVRDISLGQASGSR